MLSKGIPIKPSFATITGTHRIHGTDIFTYIFSLLFYMFCVHDINIQSSHGNPGWGPRGPATSKFQVNPNTVDQRCANVCIWSWTMLLRLQRLQPRRGQIWSYGNVWLGKLVNIPTSIPIWDFVSKISTEFILCFVKYTVYIYVNSSCRCWFRDSEISSSVFSQGFFKILKQHGIVTNNHLIVVHDSFKLVTWYVINVSTPLVIRKSYVFLYVSI